MIATHSFFPGSSTAWNYASGRFARNKLPITPEQRKSRDTQFERAVTIEEYFAQPRVQPLAAQLADSRQEIERLQHQLAVTQFRRGEESQLAPTIVEVIGKIVEISQRLFPGPVNIEYAYDPENPSDEYLVFDVVAKGEYAEYCEREFQWHEEVAKIVPGTLGEFRLCIMPQR